MNVHNILYRRCTVNRHCTLAKTISVVAWTEQRASLCVGLKDNGDRSKGGCKLKKLRVASRVQSLEVLTSAT